MSIESRKLQVGDKATTDFNRGTTLVEIVERLDGYNSQSRIGFRVRPALTSGRPDVWIDADWFEPA